MAKTTEEHHMRACLQKIEEKIGWGASGGWANYDFERLSDAIHEATSVRLSVTTLKRIWGKLRYENAPTLTTLNALAQFAGHQDWRSFRQNNTVDTVTKPHEPVSNERIAPAIPVRKINIYWAAMVVLLLGAGYFFLSSYTEREDKLNPELFKFEADKMKTEGVPNSVIFRYDATVANTDSVFIVQTWDISRKKLVSKTNHEHSAIYYYPGFFRAKLIADDQVVRTHDLWITTDGWMCLAENDPVPLYFRKTEFTKGDQIEVGREILDKYNLSLHPKPPRIRIYNQRDLGDLMNDNFTFETMVRSEFTDGTGACQFAQVLIQCKDDVIVIPLGAKACVGNMFLFFLGYEAASEDNDLSSFGTDLTQWTKLRVEVVNKNASIYVNDKLAMNLTFPNDPTGIVGVQYRFTGMGSVKDTHFSSGDKRYAFNQ